MSRCVQKQQRSNGSEALYHVMDKHYTIYLDVETEGVAGGKSTEQRNFHVRMNGVSVDAAAGMSVAAALMRAGIPCRTSVSGEPRGALCGMGICFDCAPWMACRCAARA